MPEMSLVRREILSRLAEQVNTIDLERIAKRMPHILYEAVRELNGEVEYVMVDPTRYDSTTEEND
jgi:hypothetical protein